MFQIFPCITGIKNSSCIAGLVRVERTDFLQPMFIGEVANVHAELSYASEHSLEVTVDVWAENLTNGAKRLTNQYVQLFFQFAFFLKFCNDIYFSLLIL